MFGLMLLLLLIAILLIGFIINPLIPIFEDGFESEIIRSGMEPQKTKETLTIESLDPHHRTYHAQFISDGVNIVPLDATQN